MNNDLFNFDESLADGFNTTQPKNDYEEKLKKARILCIRGRFQQALAICEEILDEDMENIGAYIEILRVHTKDFNILEGEEIEQDIYAIEKLFPDIDNEEYINYMQKRLKVVTQKTVQSENSKPSNSVENTENKNTTVAKNTSQSTKPLPPSDKNATIKGLMPLQEIIAILDDTQNHSPTEVKNAKSQLETYANNGNSYATWSLGFAYAGSNYGYPTNAGLGLKYLSKAVDLGSADAMSYLAGMYLDGRQGVKADLSKGRDLLLRAVELENDVALCNLAYYYQKGMHGFKKDISKTVELYEKAINIGSISAMYHITKFYLSDEYGMKDIAKAVEYLKKVASSDNALYVGWARKDLIELGCY